MCRRGRVVWRVRRRRRRVLWKRGAAGADDVARGWRRGRRCGCVGATGVGGAGGAHARRVWVLLSVFLRGPAPVRDGVWRLDVGVRRPVRGGERGSATAGCGRGASGGGRATAMSDVGLSCGTNQTAPIGAAGSADGSFDKPARVCPTWPRARRTTVRCSFALLNCTRRAGVSDLRRPFSTALWPTVSMPTGLSLPTVALLRREVACGTSAVASGSPSAGERGSATAGRARGAARARVGNSTDARRRGTRRALRVERRCGVVTLGGCAVAAA